jgi:hypothetical protein
MALLAIGGNVRTRQREVSRGMIEQTGHPCARAVALIAVVRNLRGFMVRLCGGRVIALVTRPTIRWRPGKLTSDVTLLAIRRDMRARQWKCGGRMTKG